MPVIMLESLIDIGTNLQVWSEDTTLILRIYSKYAEHPVAIAITEAQAMLLHARVARFFQD